MLIDILSIFLGVVIVSGLFKVVGDKSIQEPQYFFTWIVSPVLLGDLLSGVFVN